MLAYASCIFLQSVSWLTSALPVYQCWATYFLWHTSYSLTAICTRWTWGAQNGLVIDIWNPLIANKRKRWDAICKEGQESNQNMSDQVCLSQNSSNHSAFFTCLSEIFIHKSTPMKLLGGLRLRLGASNVLAKSLVLIDLKFKQSWFPSCLVLRAAMVCLPASNGGTHDK